MIIDDEGSASECWASDHGASSSHCVATASLQMGVPRNNEYFLQLFTDMRRKSDISNSRPIWLKRSEHIGERAHRDMRRCLCDFDNFRCIIFPFL